MTNLGYTPEEPVAAISTALAPGAIGIVRTSGKGCIELVSKIFSRKQALLSAAGNSLVYGWIIDPSAADADGNCAKIDEVMLGVYRGPKSFTGEDMVEINCHGGVAVVNTIFNLLLKNGFRKAQKGEFTFRAYINGKTDLTRAEAVREIIDSKTDAGRGRAAGRLAGNLFAEIDSVKKMIVDSLASIEVEIEYPEDEETISESFDITELEDARKKLNSLVESWRGEKLYQEGVRVVLCGKTNAGKSSLFNSILKEDRAIVSDIEGTTRDWLESYADFNGIPVRLFDTAGLRKTDDVIEAKGVELTKDLSREADLILYLVDSQCGLSNEDTDFIKSQSVPVVLVFNKADKISDSQKQKIIADEFFSLFNGRKIFISAKDGTSVGDVVSCVKEIILGTISGGKEDSHLSCGLGSERQKQSVAEALERVDHALTVTKDGSLGLDAVVQDLEDCLDSLGEVTGEVTPDDVLSSIFANFCVGK